MTARDARSDADRAGERDAWVRLASVPGIGDATFGRLIGRYGGAAGTLRAARDGTLRRDAPALADARGSRLPGMLVAAVEEASRDGPAEDHRPSVAGVWTLTPLDPDYPPRLLELDPPPALLFGTGDRASVAAERAVAVVGTRRPSPFGRDLASRIVRRLVDCGATIVSGLALGIDGASHAAAVERGGRTVAVIGGGHAVAGPRAHRTLQRAIVEGGGAIVSEHPPDTPPRAGTFPRRNRIISGLADATIVVEAPARSGALITARHALEQGRLLIVAPGRPLDPSAAGCLRLLRDSPARPLVGLDELVADLGYDAASVGPPAASCSGGLSRSGALALLGPSERAVADIVSRGPTGTDELVARTGLPAATVAGVLTLLALRGWVTPLGPAYLPAGPLLGDAGR